MALVRLPDDDHLVEPEAVAGPDHPMRLVTRQVAFEAGWSSGRAKKVVDLFDSLAEGWAKTHGDPVRLAPVRDGLRRGEVDLAGRWLELGSGTGAGTRVLAAELGRTVTAEVGLSVTAEVGLSAATWAGRMVATDLSSQMLANAPAEIAPRVRADASRLPYRADQFDGILMVNMLLFPDEVDRVLAPDGNLLWVNTLGHRTPIHLSAEDLIAALPGDWAGTTARSGSGFWASVARV